MADLLPQDIPVHPPEHPEDHEQSDVPVRALFWTLAIFVIAGIIIHFGIWFLFKAFDRHQASLDVKLTNVETKAAVPIDRPRLQGVPGFNATSASEETAAMMKEMKERLFAEGRLPNGRYHIRIDRAMQMVVENKQLNAATQPATKPQLTTQGTNADR